MKNNEGTDFNKNLKEIKELSEKLNEPLEEPITILYYDFKKKIIKYKGGYVNNKYEGRGILYKSNGNILYDGYFSNNEYNGFGKIYDDVKYEGFFRDGKKDGKGLLYYNNNEKIYLNGIFDMNNYVEGILYNPNGNKIFEGLFINNKPKEGKNIELYELNGELKYEGDFFNGQYHGHGILYEKGNYEKKGIFSEFKYIHYVGEFKNDKYNGQGKLYMDNCFGKYLFYEGNFDNSYFSGNGKIYYQNKKLFYEGQFENNNLNGKGIKYYKNGNIKFQGIFSNNICTFGVYYSPDGTKLYEGEFKSEIPLESNNIIIYDNNTNKRYQGEIHNGLYEGKGVEYCPLIKDKILFEGNFKKNEYILPNIEIKESEDRKKRLASKIVLLSHGDVPGKSCFLERIQGNEFHLEGLATIGTDKIEIGFENNNLRYKLIFWDTSGNERFMSVAFKLMKNSFLALYFFDLHNTYNEIDLSYLDYIKEENENIKIFAVGNKLDMLYEQENIDIINEEYFERFRRKAVEAMNTNLVDKYFEISSKTMEGVDKLMNSIKLDSLIYLKSLSELKNISNDKEAKKNTKKKKKNCIIF